MGSWTQRRASIIFIFPGCCIQHPLNRCSGMGRESTTGILVMSFDSGKPLPGVSHVHIGMRTCSQQASGPQTSPHPLGSRPLRALGAKREGARRKSGVRPDLHLRTRLTGGQCENQDVPNSRKLVTGFPTLIDSTPAFTPQVGVGRNRMHVHNNAHARISPAASLTRASNWNPHPDRKFFPTYCKSVPEIPPTDDETYHEGKANTPVNQELTHQGKILQ